MKSAMRARRLRAVIRATEYGLLVKMSDGRMCTVAMNGAQPKEAIMATARQRARHLGARSVEVCA